MRRTNDFPDAGRKFLTSVVRWFRRNPFLLNHLDKGRPT
nr:MAG TPA: hypothetical protein [Caudoviricetes sp.]DAU48074.1 MAG TPA: hypothetical protein [Caudoviricetes sp.]